VIPTIERELELGGPIECAALALAGWARYLAVTSAADRAPDPHGERAIALALASLDHPLTFLELDEVFSPPLRHSDRFRKAFSEASGSLAADGSFGAVERLLA
jgi:mannitol 2-dehydrogenase